MVDIVWLRVKPSCETSVVGVGDHELESDAASWSSNASKFWFGLHPLLNFIRGCSVCFRKVGQKCALDDGRVYRHLESCPKGICTSPPRQWKHLSASSNSWGNLVSWETFTKLLPLRTAWMRFTIHIPHCPCPLQQTHIFSSSVLSSKHPGHVFSSLDIGVCCGCKLCWVGGDCNCTTLISQIIWFHNVWYPQKAQSSSDGGEHWLAHSEKSGVYETVVYNEILEWYSVIISADSVGLIIQTE
jgi:hypothetical protein